MKVFVTGATGFVGTAVVEELISHGHEVLGLARSNSRADALMRAGAEILRGDLETPATLFDGARLSDAIVHAGFVHDFSRFAQACEIDRIAIETLGSAIEGAGKPLIVTAGVAFLDAAGPITVEADRALAPTDDYPRASEAAATALCDRGIPASLMRLPPSVHGRGDHGFVPMLIKIARQKGRSAFIGDGGNLWPAVHVRDAARAYRLAVEYGTGDATYHAVAEQGVPFRSIAEATALGLGVPCVSLSVDEARAHFDWFFGFASSDQTRATLGWNPTQPDLLTDMAESGYFRVSTN
jgi:nucleoside-diphosphate-sugar epimerase